MARLPRPRGGLRRARMAGIGGRGSTFLPSQDGRHPVKVRSSLKSLKVKPGSTVVRRHGSTVVRRHGTTYVINKVHSRYKARQG